MDALGNISGVAKGHPVLPVYIAVNQQILLTIRFLSAVNGTMLGFK